MRHLAKGRLPVSLIIVVASTAFLQGCPATGQGELANRVEALEAALALVQSDLADTEAELAMAQEKLEFFSVDENEINGLTGPHLIVQGCNVHVRSGSGETDDAGILTGLGNLIVGYNEAPDPVVNGRTGSHNLVVGAEHEYVSFGGFVAGFRNTVSGPACSVSGGFQNTASAFYSSATGGRDNMATGNQSSVQGGLGNTSSAQWASVSGGSSNTASGTSSLASGGNNNAAESDQSSVHGGWFNTASGEYSSVNGGRLNEASGNYASVGGGNNRTAAAEDDWVAGTLFEDN